MAGSLKSRINGATLEELHIEYDTDGQPHFVARFGLLLDGRRHGITATVTDELEFVGVLDGTTCQNCVRDVSAACNALRDKAEGLFIAYHGSVEAELQPGEIVDF